MELSKFYLKEKAKLFWLFKLLFIKGGKQQCLPFVCSNLGVEIFLKKREHQKRMSWNRGLTHLCILCIGISTKFYAKPVCFLIVLWLQKQF